MEAEVAFFELVAGMLAGQKTAFPNDYGMQIVKLPEKADARGHS